jgi:Cysteine-rich secretory protein family
VPTPTYASGSAQAVAFSTLNTYRSTLGVGEVQQDPILDTSASAHATYLNVNLASGALTVLSHDEVTTLADFYADTPLDRAQKAGAVATEWIGEALGDSEATPDSAASSDCVAGLLDTVYHLQTMTGPQQTVGIGFVPQGTPVNFAVCSFDFGSTSGVYGTPVANSIPIYGGQQMAATTIVHAPLSGETNVATAMRSESPNPVPSFAAPGRPLMVRVRADQAGDVLTVSSFTLTASDGTVVSGEIMIPAGAAAGSAASAIVDPNVLLGQGIAFFIPSSPLAANTVYTASFTGARDGTPINLSWPFTTGN